MPTRFASAHPGSLSAAATALWAKTDGDTEALDPAEKWLSLPQHMIDSACVAELLWDHWLADSIRGNLARSLHLEDDEVRTLYVWLAGVHDLGKATLSFQTQLEARGGYGAFVERLRRAGLPVQMGSLERGAHPFPHALASGAIVKSWLAALDVPKVTAHALASVVDAHHGIASDPAKREHADTIIDDYDDAWKSLHTELLDFAASYCDIDSVLRLLPRRIPAPPLTLLTGLVIMADWIASNQEGFPLDVAGGQKDRAEHGYATAFLTLPWEPDLLDIAALDAHMRRLFAWPDNFAARDVQRIVAQACDDADGPALVIVEAPTGEGKTEAALVAANMLATTSGSGGFIMAAPTMATANGLFNRVLEFARHSARDGAVTSMFLGHSKAALNTEFRELKIRGIHGYAGQGGDSSGPDSRGADGGVIASQWLSGRKKGILSNVTVATVDQVLLMALQAKHSMLRHLGLAGKVVIIDEVHAYDTYMSEYLKTALRWLARYRAPVVLLSATLPLALKRELVEAYASEYLDAKALDALALGTAYPLVTTASTTGVTEYPVPASAPDLHASVEVIDDSLATMETLLDGALADGGCVLVLCNTVRRAQETFTALDARFPGDVELHHAAFIASDRARKERELHRQLGPRARRGKDRPWRRIVVATQVAEQSLDIDVDLLMTDMAPIDLVIQRIGRLHRHKRPDSDRPENLRTPRVFVRGIEDPDAPTFESGTAAIYDPTLLLTSLAVLQSGPALHGFTRPDDIATLVHSAYGDQPPVPEAWKDAHLEAKKQSAKNRDTARRRSGTFRFPEPFAAADLHSLFGTQASDVDTVKGEARGLAQVRDSDPSIEVIPIIVTDTGYHPVDADPDLASELMADATPSFPTDLALASATVRLPSRFSRYASVFEDTLNQLEPLTPQGWHGSHLLKGQLALPLDTDRSIIVGGRRLTYSPELGLVDHGPDSTLTQGES